MTKSKTRKGRFLTLNEEEDNDTDMLQKKGISVVDIYRLGLQEMKASQGLSISKKVC